MNHTTCQTTLDIQPCFFKLRKKWAKPPNPLYDVVPGTGFEPAKRLAASNLFLKPQKKK